MWHIYTHTLIRHWMNATEFEDVISLTSLSCNTNSQRKLWGKGKQRLAVKCQLEYREEGTVGCLVEPPKASTVSSVYLCPPSVILSPPRERQREHFSIVYSLMHRFMHIYWSLLLGTTVLGIEDRPQGRIWQITTNEAPTFRVMGLGGGCHGKSLGCTEAWIIYFIFLESTES